MKILKTLVVVTAFFLLNTTSIIAQNNFKIHFGPSIPIGDFGSEDYDDPEAGGAGIGFQVGGQYLRQFNDSGLGLFVGLDIIYNPLSEQTMDDALEDLSILGDVEITFYKHYNLPISVGLFYNLNINEYLDLFTNAGMTINTLIMTDMEIVIDNTELITEIDPSFSIGFKLGVGLVLKDKYTFEINYYGLGNHNIESTMSSGGDSVDLDSFNAKIETVALTFGFKF